MSEGETGMGRTASARYWMLLAPLSIGVVNCHHAPAPSALAPASAEPLVLEIENHNWSDVNIFVLHDGRQNRLGTAIAAKDATMIIPPQYQGDTHNFQLVLYRIGGKDSFTSQTLTNMTGNTVRLTIESKLEHSSVGVW